MKRAVDYLISDMKEINLGAVKLPPGGKVFGNTDKTVFCGYCPIGKISYSGAMPTRFAARKWVIDRYDFCSGITPDWGQLWLYKKRIVLVLGNCTDEEGIIWCADNASGEMLYPEARKLQRLVELQLSQPLEIMVQKCKGWASAGNVDAMWWLGWFFEGENHKKSVWYYIAAMRKDPQRYGWGFSRVYADAQNPVMCKDIPAPDLEFLSEIQEFNGAKVWGDGQEALRQAESS